ncbi:unnamed protein product [Psylliodes chrysocephalus]|uniref:Uncharacterized protein n=1 Tax=Psylliodes chrysocephalus TaxID=3402493 RepID=A0A9P0GEK9_9CUCU|nr:unnamed protein product [Psylliodes chrysocephala]
MTKHIKKCFKCPEEMKKNLYLVPTTVSTKVDLSMHTSTPKEKLNFSQRLKELEVDVSFGIEEANLAGPSSSRSQTFPVVSLSETESSATATNASTSNISANSACSTFNFNRPQPSPFIVNNNRGGLLTFVDHMDNQLNESLNQSLAKAIFVSGTPLSMVEHPLWLEFFKRLRPSFKPPSRYRLSSTYLKAQYTEMQNEVTSQLKDSKHLHLQCDGWSNIRNVSIVNFVISKPEPLCVESVATKENRHKASYLAELIINIIEKYGTEKFLVIIGDNASNMRAALAKEKYPSIIPLGCLAHLLHLLCEDILKCNTIKSFMATVTSISLLSNKSVLQKLSVSEEAEISSEMKRQILDDGVFWVRVEKMVNILNPIVDLITALESNTPLIYNVYTKFHTLQETLKQEMPESPLQKIEEKMCFQSCNLKSEELLDAISFVCEIGSSMGINTVDIRQNIADYRDKEGLWRRSFIWEGVKDSRNEKAISPMLWWRGLRGTCVLADVAVRILGAPVTSAATERTFSTFSWIHCKKRNRLTTERAGQIAYLSHNWNLLNNAKKLRTVERSQADDSTLTKSQSEEFMQISNGSGDCSDVSDDEDGHMSLSSHSSDQINSEPEYSDLD